MRGNASPPIAAFLRGLPGQWVSVTLSQLWYGLRTGSTPMSRPSHRDVRTGAYEMAASCHSTLREPIICLPSPHTRQVPSAYLHMVIKAPLRVVNAANT